MICNPIVSWIVCRWGRSAWEYALRPALVVCIFALSLYGTYFGLIRWVDTLPDPPGAVATSTVSR